MNEFIKPCVVVLLCCLSRPALAEETVETILFGSCIKQDRPMPLLRRMADEKADAVIFLGDNIYADTSDMEVMRSKYDRLRSNPDFQSLLMASPIYATWDDHDYGVNDGGADYPQRKLAQKEYLNFWQVPADSPRRNREGVYDAVILGPVGKRVQIILLDTRYFRSPLKKSEERRVGGPYLPDDGPQKTMLGEAQWNWLGEQLRRSAEVRILASSIQLLASDAGQETWSNLPRERTRLLSLIQSTSANGVFIISGDRHWSEYSRVEKHLDYPIYDFTSSSFNQIHPRGTPTENRFRTNLRTYHKENYGLIKIDWSKSDPAIQVQIRDASREVQIEQALKLSELQSN